MFVLCECSAERVRLMTDRLGFRAAYVARDGAGRVTAAGTHVEALAAFTGLAEEFDTASLGELIVHNYVTFPHTTRRGISELPPASLITVAPAEGRIDVRRLWAPAEPARDPSARAVADELEQALRHAGEDITRGSRRVAVTLSGGKDSRAVLGAMPHDRVAACLTYCTRENRETEVARRVAEAHGVPHVLVRRDPEFYARLLEEGSHLLGTEVRANAHGMCLLDAGLQDEYDLIVGGQLSDTLLKDHFMPPAEYERLRPRSWREVFGGLRPGSGRGRTADASVANTRGRHALEVILRDDMREAVAARREARLREVREIRPRSAEEWFRFWPCSRQDDCAHSMGNSRLFAWDVLFMHTAVVDVAARIPPRLRCDGALSSLVFSRLYGPAAGIEDANTGLPMNAPESAVRRRVRTLRRDTGVRREFRRLSGSDAPWNDIQGSWVDSEVLQRQAPRWQAYRSRLRGSPALDVIAPLLRVDAAKVVGEYDGSLPHTTNQMIMQLALVIDGVLSGRGSRLAAAV
jgi:asparagine synthetase B (glutamine-hydrolysing)